jgi:3-oxoacyl-[acyl-carrier protein] reductase
MSSSLDSKSILITGGSRGIGYACAEICAEAGWNLILASQSAQKVELAAEGLVKKYAVNVDAFGLDVSSKSEISELKKNIKAKSIDLDGAVLSAGVMELSPLGMWSESHIGTQIDTNLIGVLNCLELSVSLTKPRKGSSVVLISSVVAQNPGKGQIVYSGTKAGVEGIARASSAELGRRRIRVNAVAPGVIDTDLTKVLSEENREEISLRTSLGRLGTPRDVASVVKFLLSEESMFVTGAVIPVDGGYRP